MIFQNGFHLRGTHHKACKFYECNTQWYQLSSYRFQKCRDRWDKQIPISCSIHSVQPWAYHRKAIQCLRKEIHRLISYNITKYCWWYMSFIMERMGQRVSKMYWVSEYLTLRQSMIPPYCYPSVIAKLFFHIINTFIIPLAKRDYNSTQTEEQR